MWFGVDVWGIHSCFVLPTPPLSAGAGLGNKAALLWNRTRFLSFGPRLGWCFVFRPAHTSRRAVPGCGLGNRATQLWHRTAIFLCSFHFRPASPPKLGVGGVVHTLATPNVAQDYVTSCFLYRTV